MGNFLFIEPFYGGSHKEFAQSLKAFSKHNIELLTLPDRFWKWRMRGAALFFSQLKIDYSVYDGIICSNMLSLSDFKALAGPNLPPLILYFHENQILYPLNDGVQEDLHYGFTDITSCFCADYVLFNSHYHKEVFYEAIPSFLKRFPDFIPQFDVKKLIDKSSVLYPGVKLDKDFKPNARDDNYPVILWNHRWEHDKNPEDFFKILYELDEECINFKMIILGEQYKNSPKIFREAKTKLQHRILHWGFAEDYAQYNELLKKGHIVLSTSNQENFGISVVEAIGACNFPLLPNRLSYGELIPETYHKFCIYKNHNDLKRKIQKLIQFYDNDLMSKIAKENLRFSWEQLISDYDNFLDKIKKDAL